MTNGEHGLLSLEVEAGWPRLAALTRGRKRWLALLFLEERDASPLRQRLSDALLTVERPLATLTLPAAPQEALRELTRAALDGMPGLTAEAGARPESPSSEDLAPHDPPAEDAAPEWGPSCRWCTLPSGGASLAARLVELETVAPALEAREATAWRKALEGGLVLVLPAAARGVVERRTPRLLAAADAVIGGEVTDANALQLPDHERLERAALALKAAAGARARGSMTRTRGQALRALAAAGPAATSAHGAEAGDSPTGEPASAPQLLQLRSRALDILAHAEHDLSDPAACLDHVRAWLALLEPDQRRDRIRAHVLGARAERLMTGPRSPGARGLEHAEQAAALARELWQVDPVQSAHGRLLSLALDILGLIHRDSGQAAHALEVQREALDLDRSLVERDADDPILLRNLSVGLEHLGDTLREADQEAEAARCYAECLALRHSRAGTEGTDPEALHEVFEVLWRIAALSDGSAPPDSTRSTLESARDFLLRAQRLAPDSARIARDLAAVDDWLRDIPD